MAKVAYNPSDPVQQRFLAALAKGETGNSPYAWSEGVGGTNLAGSATDQYGFPHWDGVGNSHAAGKWQFQPGTWDTVAAQHGLDFQKPQDQAAGAWYLAQDVYATKTGKGLEDSLVAGDYTDVQTALVSTWPSVIGNQASPTGLSGALAGPGDGANDPLGLSGAGAGQPSGGGMIANIEDFFVRFGLIIIGAIIVVVALWQLLASQGIVPAPADAAKGVLKAVTA